MSIATFEGFVEKGKIRLSPGVRLPEKTKVYVIVPEVQIEGTAHLSSPHLANPKEAADFVLEITEEPFNDQL